MTRPGETAETRTAIVTALGEELRPLVARVSGLKRARAGDLRVFLGRLGTAPVAMAATGVGRRRAERGAGALLDAYPAARLLGVGVVGGISEGLEVGEVLVGREVREARGPVTPPDGAWVAGVLRSGGARGAILVTVDEVLCHPAGKAALRARHADGAPVAADMESAGWAQAATDRGLPYLVVRSVLDRAQDALPRILSGCGDGQGGLDRRRVVGRLLLRPGALRELLALRRQVGVHAEGLARRLEGVLHAAS